MVVVPDWLRPVTAWEDVAGKNSPPAAKILPALDVNKKRHKKRNAKVFFIKNEAKLIYLYNSKYLQNKKGYPLWIPFWT